MANRFILHVMDRPRYESERAGHCIGRASVDRCGFVHCSDIDTYALVAPNFKDDPGEKLVLVIDREKLTSETRWEDGGGLDFPHIYGLVDDDAVAEVLEHLWSADRVWIPNPELEKYREMNRQ